MSASFSAAEAVEWTGGRLASGALTDQFHGAGIDTRTIEPGQLFIAIRGERHDGHAFVEPALERGTAGLVVEESWLSKKPALPDTCIIGVADSTTALGALAKGHRNTFDGPVIAVTGSNGKTTTKELIHAILSTCGPCLKNPGNLNNEFGLPLSLLGRSDEDQKAVVELGMNHRGEIARLTAIANPDIGLITNIGSAHIEFLGSQEEIAQEKGDLVAGLRAEAIAILNHDDTLAMTQAIRAPGSVRTFGRDPGADVGAEDVKAEPDGHYSFRLVAPEGSTHVCVRGLAETTVINSLAASAAALAAGTKLDEVREGLANFRGVQGRMASLRLAGGGHLVDDTYNANPQSMRSALESLVRLKGDGRTIAVLGEMGELGASSCAAHREIGRLASELGVDRLFAFGENAQWIADGALEAGMSEEAVLVGTEHKKMTQSIRQFMRTGDRVLVKGSRAMRMERIVESLAAEEKH